MEEKIIKIMQLVQIKKDNTVEFPEQAPEPDKWIFYFEGIKMLSGSL